MIASTIVRRVPADMASTMMYNAIIAVSGALSGVVLARVLGPNGRGEVAVAVLWPTLGAILGDLGLSFALCYHAGTKPERMSELWTAALLASLVVGAFSCVTCYLLAPAARAAATPTGWTALREAIPAIPFLLLTLFEGYLLLGSGHVREFNWTRVFPISGYALGTILIAAAGCRTAPAFAASFTVAQICSALLATYLVVKRLRPRYNFSSPIWTDLIPYGFKTYLSAIAGQANLRLDQTIMSFIVPVPMLGQYVVAVAVSSGIAPVANVFATLVLPRTLPADGIDARRRQVLKWFLFGLGPVALLAAAGVILTPWLLPLLFGTNYAKAIPSAQILLAAAIAQGSLLILENGLRALGQPGRPAVAQATALVLTIVLLILLLPRMGIMGAAVTSLVAYSTACLVDLYFVLRTARVQRHSAAIDTTLCKALSTVGQDCREAPNNS